MPMGETSVRRASPLGEGGDNQKGSQVTLCSIHHMTGPWRSWWYCAYSFRCPGYFTTILKRKPNKQTQLTAQASSLTLSQYAEEYQPVADGLSGRRWAPLFIPRHTLRIGALGSRARPPQRWNRGFDEGHPQPPLAVREAP